MKKLDLEFFENPTSGNLMCITSEGVIVAKKGMTESEAIEALQNGDARLVEGEYNGKPSKSILVGFGRAAAMKITIDKLVVRKSTPAVKVEVEYID